MEGKVCLITGASSGIGRQTAVELAGRGAEIIGISRHPRRLKRAEKYIARKSGNSAVRFFQADLSSFASIRQVTRQIRDNYDKLHVLINNAGGYFARRRLSEDGIEMTLALNHFSYFLVTKHLLDLIISSSPARIINVSSNLHRNQTIDFDDLQMEENYTASEAYGRSKLANLLFTYHLAHQLSGTGVTVNALHPGFVSTRLAYNNGLLYRLGMLLMRPLQMSAKKGAQTPVYLATSDEVAQVTGQYFYQKEIEESSRQSRDREMMEKLWKVSEELSRED